jgi:hypothetical protein
MTTVALAARTPRTRALGILVAVGALALASQFALPIPGTPVPITLQPMLVVLAGLLLGPVDAAVAMVAYLAIGMTGLPVFSPIGAPGLARLLGPTGGYLLAYAPAAAVAGWLGAGRASFVTRALAAMAGIAAVRRRARAARGAVRQPRHRGADRRASLRRRRRGEGARGRRGQRAYARDALRAA